MNKNIIPVYSKDDDIPQELSDKPGVLVDDKNISQTIENIHRLINVIVFVSYATADSKTYQIPRIAETLTKLPEIECHCIESK